MKRGTGMRVGHTVERLAAFLVAGGDDDGDGLLSGHCFAPIISRVLAVALFLFLARSLSSHY
jgi:hypothetical protein